jgi:hypothetical protein
MAKLPRRVWSGVRKHRGKSDLWRYLLTNYDGLTKQGVGTAAGPSWHDLATVLSEVGQKNREGGDLTGNAVRKVWARVQDYVDKHGAEGRRKPREHRVPAPPGRRYQPPPLASPPQLSTENRTTETEAEAEARAEANIEHMLRTVAERSGRARPDKRTS